MRMNDGNDSESQVDKDLTKTGQGPSPGLRDEMSMSATAANSAQASISHSFFKAVVSLEDMTRSLSVQCHSACCTARRLTCSLVFSACCPMVSLG